MSNGMCRQTEVVLTVSHGEFEDRGKLGIGTHGREVSATCQGRHVVSMRKDVREHLFLWRAPSLLASDSIGSSNGTAAMSSGTSVTFNVTLACHEYGAFRRAPMLSVTAGAALPDSNRSSCQTHEGTSAEHDGGSEHAVLTTDVPLPRSYGGFDALTLLHAWLAAAAFAGLLSVLGGLRTIREATAQTGGQSALSSWCINRIGDSWFAAPCRRPVRCCVRVRLAAAHVGTQVCGRPFAHAILAREAWPGRLYSGRRAADSRNSAPSKGAGHQPMSPACVVCCACRLRRQPAGCGHVRSSDGRRRLSRTTWQAQGVQACCMSGWLPSAPALSSTHARQMRWLRHTYELVNGRHAVYGESSLARVLLDVCFDAWEWSQDAWRDDGWRGAKRSMISDCSAGP